MLALAAGVTVLHLADIIHPAWTRVRSVLSIAGHVAGLAILWVLFNGRPLIEATPVNGADPAEILAQTETQMRRLPKATGGVAYLSDRMIDLLKRAEREAQRLAKLYLQAGQGLNAPAAARQIEQGIVQTEGELKRLERFARKPGTQRSYARTVAAGARSSWSA